MTYKQVDTTCPCCETKLKIDTKTGEVIWQEKKEKVLPSLTDMVKGLDQKRKERENTFKRQSETQEDRGRLLDDIFKESQKHVDRSPEKPLRDFDLD
jgi:hypothetical protein